MPSVRLLPALIICLLLTATPARAGIVTKKNILTTNKSHPISSPGSMYYRVPALKKNIPSPGDISPEVNTGWAGTASLVCGIIGLATFPLYPLILSSVCAIIFGAIGLSKKRRKKGLAIAGLTLGIAVIVLFAAILAVVYSSLK